MLWFFKGGIANTKGEKGRNEEMGKGDFMIMDDLDQSLKEGKHCALVISQLEEQKIMLALEGRIPLLDCTNKLRAEYKEHVKVRKAAAKGKWKRLARLQGLQATKQEIKVWDNLGDLISKRERAENELETNVVGLDQPQKKMKAMKMVSNLNNNKVEETSLNWSRPIR